MKLPTSRSVSKHADAALLLSLLALAPTYASAESSWACDKFTLDDQEFNLSSLGGPHAVVISEHRSPNYHNTTYTLDICQPLKRSDDVPEEKACEDGSYVCGIKRTISDESDVIDDVINIAGELESKSGKAFEPATKAMKTEGGEGEDSQTSQWQGIQLTMNGGWFYPDGSQTKRPQRAVVEFLCDHDYEGTENEFEPADHTYKSSSSARRLAARDDDDEGAKPPEHVQLGDPENAALRFESYGPAKGDSDADELRLTWRTKHACSKRDGDSGGDGDGGDDGDGGKKSGGIGWFAWIIIIFFLGTAAYLIFGSWLNYTRYGARGWDLVPHGDTIRDVPYLLKDWTRRALNTVQGSGSRGGYSAV